MLTLGVKVGEWVYLGDNIRVKVTSTRKGRAQLGFETPRDMKILREKLVQRGTEPAEAALHNREG